MFVKTLICGLCAVNAASAAVIVASDDFQDTNRANQSLPTSMQWFGASSTTQLDASSGALVIPLVSNSGAMAYFAAHENSLKLAEGESVTLSFSITIPASAQNGDNSFLFGLLNSGGTRQTADGSFNNGVFNNDVGYFAVQPLTGSHSTRNKLVERFGGANNLITSSNFTQLGTGAATPNFDVGGPYTYSLEIERTGAAEVTLTSTLVGKVAGVDTTVTVQRTDDAVIAGTTGFDSVFIYTGGNPAVTIDNVEISVVPEPVSVALLGAFGLALRRRRGV